MTYPEIPGYVRRSPWKPLLGIPAGGAVGIGLGALPSPWDLVGILLFCVLALGVCVYFLLDLRRDMRRNAVLMRRWEHLLEQRERP